MASHPAPVHPPAAAAAAGAAPWGAAEWGHAPAPAWAAGRPLIVVGSGASARAYVAIPLPAGAPRPPGSLVVATDGSLVDCGPQHPATAVRPRAHAGAHAATASAAAAALGVGPSVPDVPDAWAAAALCDEFAAAVPQEYHDASSTMRRSLSFGDLPLGAVLPPPASTALPPPRMPPISTTTAKRRLSVASRDAVQQQPHSSFYSLPPTSHLPTIKRARSAACLLTGVGALLPVSQPASPTHHHAAAPPSPLPLHPPAWLDAPPIPATHGALLGEVVWARMLSFPWWPAQVVPTPPAAHELRHKEGAIYVVFFGDSNCAWLSPRSLDRFGAGYAKRAAKPRKDLQAAVDCAWRALGLARPPADALPAGFDATRPALAPLR